MAKLQTVWVKYLSGNISTGGQGGARSLLSHSLRTLTVQQLKSKNHNLNEDHMKWNLYVDDKGNFVDNESAHDAATKKFDNAILKLEHEHNKINYGYDVYSREELAAEIKKKAFDQIKIIDPSLFKKFDSASSTEELKDLIRKNDIEFKWNYGVRKDTRRTFDEWAHGVKIRQQKVSVFDEKTGNYKLVLRNVKVNSNNSPLLINDAQVHLSGQWFEDQGWVSYDKKVVAMINQDNMSTYNTEQIIGFKVKQPEKLQEWFKANVETFRKQMRESLGSDDMFLSAALHLDETKPHIHLQISNIWERERFFSKEIDIDGKVKIISIPKQTYIDIQKQNMLLVDQDAKILKSKEQDALQTEKQLGPNWKEERPDLFIEYTGQSKKLKNSENGYSEVWSKKTWDHLQGWDANDELLSRFKNGLEMSEKVIYPMHVKEFDKELSPPGIMKKTFGLDYMSMDKYKLFTKTSTIDFENDIDGSIENIRVHSELSRVRYHEASEVADIMSRIASKLRKNISADITKERSLLAKALISESEASRYIEQIKSGIKSELPKQKKKERER
jgi:Plasmid recombination enzyme